jgi:hypothetical protein
MYVSAACESVAPCVVRSGRASKSPGSIRTGFQGNGKGKGAALAGAAGQEDLTAMHFDQALGYGQPHQGEDPDADDIAIDIDGGSTDTVADEDVAEEGFTASGGDA